MVAAKWISFSIWYRARWWSSAWVQDLISWTEVKIFWSKWGIERDWTWDEGWNEAGSEIPRKASSSCNKMLKTSDSLSHVVWSKPWAPNSVTLSWIGGRCHLTWWPLLSVEVQWDAGLQYLILRRYPFWMTWKDTARWFLFEVELNIRLLPLSTWRTRLSFLNDQSIRLFFLNWLRTELLLTSGLNVELPFRFN